MHELAMMESIVDAVEEQVGPARVSCVRLQIGSLTGVVPDALRFCFDVCARGTTLEGARLEIDEIPGRGRCRACGSEMALVTFVDLCPCGSAELEITAGRELRVRELEVH